MSFETDFPSLYEDEYIKTQLKSIQENCLDKQRVREAIENMFEDDDWIELVGRGLKDRILARLGL